MKKTVNLPTVGEINAILQRTVWGTWYHVTSMSLWDKDTPRYETSRILAFASEVARDMALDGVYSHCFTHVYTCGTIDAGWHTPDQTEEEYPWFAVVVNQVYNQEIWDWTLLYMSESGDGHACTIHQETIFNTPDNLKQV